MARFLWMIWVLTGAVYVAMLAWSLPYLTQAAGGLPMFDMRPAGYSADEAMAILMALNSDARGFYLTTQHWLDLVFPALEAAALVLTYPRLFPRVIALPLMVVAVAGAVFDWLENAAVAALLRADLADVTPAMIEGASRWTVLKSSAVTLAMTALLIGLVLAMWRRLRRRQA